MFFRTERIRPALLTAALTVALVGCATGPKPTTGSPAFEQGRSAYQAGDYRSALPLLHQEADAGNPEAQYALGYMLFNGLGTERDPEAAMQWIRLSAEQGHSPAVRALGELATLGARHPGPETKAEPEDE